MPTPEKFKAAFIENKFYHIVFKSIDGLLLFPNGENKIFFLDKFKFFLSDVVEIWAYCLLDNHCHFIVCIKDLDTIQANIYNIPELSRTVAMKKFLEAPNLSPLLDELLEREFNRLMVSYTNSYNIYYNRKGGLFRSPFRRSRIMEDGHLQQAIIYVHANAQKHNLLQDFRQHQHCSYWDIWNNQSCFIVTQKVLNFFGSKDTFIEMHDKQVNWYYSNGWPNSTLE